MRNRRSAGKEQASDSEEDWAPERVLQREGDDGAQRRRRRGRDWKGYAGTLLVAAAAAVLWSNVVRKKGGSPAAVLLGGGGSLLGSESCKVFLSGGHPVPAGRVVSTARGEGCGVYLGDPWEDVADLRSLLSSRLSNPTSFSSISAGPTIPTSGLSAKDFTDTYAAPHLPVVLQGLLDAVLPSGEVWDPRMLSQRCGSRTVSPSKYNASVSGEAWAGMVGHEMGAVRLDAFLEALEAGGTGNAYVHDWSLPNNCPEVLEGIGIPKFFTNDYLQLVEHRTRYRKEWPSLFAGSEEAQTGVHLDNLGSHAWLLQLSGGKIWRTVSGNQSSLLYSTPYSYEVDLFSPNFTHHPLASLLHVTEFRTGPGDLIFVPAGVFHQVRNVNASLAMTSNYIDYTCLPSALRSMAEVGTVDEGVYRLHNELRKLNESDLLPRYPGEEDLPWHLFKSRRLHDHPESASKLKRHEEATGVRRIWGYKQHDVYLFVAVVATVVFVIASAWILWDELSF